MMTDQTAEQLKEPLSYMKQWFLTKLQSQSGVIEGMDKANDVPKIVISKGSDRSINRIMSPLINHRPSPISKSWQNGDRLSGSRTTIESPCMTPMSARSDIVTSSTRRFYSSPSPAQRKEKVSRSVPATPLDRSVLHLNSPGYNSLKCASPLFRFPASNTPNINMTPSTSKSELDYPGVCASCGQEKYYGSRDLVGFKDHSSSANVSATTTPLLQRRTGRSLNLRRTISCRTTSGTDKFEPFPSSAHSMSFDEQKRTTSCRLKRVQRTGSREKYRSTISLTRSWSINIDSLKVVKTSPNRNASRKMSLNDNDLARVNERRRSSLLRLLCVNQSDDERSHDDESYTGSAMSLASADDILTRSPAVTRTMKFAKSGDPVENFRSTFESDSIRIPSAYGQIKLMFQYFNEKNELQVTLLKCINVANGHTGTLGIFAKVCLMPGKVEKRTSDDIHDTHDPVFYELFTLRMPLGDLMEKQLRIKLYNKPGVFSISQPVGECSIPLFDYDLTAVSVIWQNLKISKGQKKMHLDEFDLDLIEREKKNKNMFSDLLCGLRRKP